jgi:hypothetical protein
MKIDSDEKHAIFTHEMKSCIDRNGGGFQHLLRNVTSLAFEYSVKGKGKAIPLQAWTGPEGARRLRLPDFKKIGT